MRTDRYLFPRDGKASNSKFEGLTTFIQVVRKTTSGAVVAAPSKRLQGATVVQSSSIGFRAVLQYLLGLCPRAPPESSFADILNSCNPRTKKPRFALPG